MLLHALAPLTFSPHAAQPSRSRHAVRSRPLMREACKDTLCYSLSSAKPESVEKLGPAQLQQQIDLLQRQISIDKAQLAGQSAPDLAPVSDAGCKDTVCWALSNAKPEKLQADQLQEQVALLEQRLEVDLAKLQGRPPVAAPPPVVETPAVEAPVAAAPEPPPPAVVPEVAAPEPPPPVVVPEVAAPEPPQAATSFFETVKEAAVPEVMEAAPELIKNEAAVAVKSEMAAVMASPAAEVAAGGGVPWNAFLFAFTVFPAAVIIVSKLMDNTLIPKSNAEVAPGSDGPVRGGPDGRSAPEIVLGGFASLGKDPTGWLFGKPSELYSNAVAEPFVVDQAPHPHPHPHPTLSPEPPNLTPNPEPPNP